MHCVLCCIIISLHIIIARDFRTHRHRDGVCPVFMKLANFDSSVSSKPAAKALVCLDSHDCVLLQLYSPVFGTRAEPVVHPFVPACQYVYLTDDFLLCHPRNIISLRLLIPEITRQGAPEDSRRHVRNNLPRHNFFCLPHFL